MFPFHRTKKKNTQLVSVYDIGSASIAGAVVRIESGEKPKLLYATRKEIVSLNTPRPRHFKKQSFSTYAEVVAETERHLRMVQQQEKHVHTGEALVVLSAPWYLSQTHTVHVEHPTPVSIHDADIHQHVEHAYKDFLTSALVKEFGADTHELFERRIIRVALNGYETARPEGKEAKIVDISVVFSIVSAESADLFRDIIKKERANMRVSFCTFPLAAFDMVRSIGSHKEDFLFLDIAGEVSELALVHDGTLAGSISFPVGKRTMVRHVAHTLHVNTDEALSLIHLYKEGGMTKKEAKRIEESVSVATELWMRPFEHALDTLGEHVSVPSTVYLTADEDVSLWFAGIIDDMSAGARSFEAGTFSVVPVTVSYLQKAYTAVPDVLRDVFLIIDAVFATHMYIPPGEIHKDGLV